MEVESRLSSSQADQYQNTQSSSDRRKSGRVSKKPELFSRSYNDADSPGGSKRKRANGDANEDTGEEDEVSESESDDAADDETDEEELRERKRVARLSSAKKPSGSIAKTKSRPSHSAKKVKVGNGIGGQLAMRPATNGKVRRARKPKVRPSLAAGETGLYGTFDSVQSGASLTVLAEVFGQSNNADTAAAEWLTQYQQDQTVAMRDLVNFILKCTGTDLGIEDSDITDVDHAPDRIADIQNQYQEQGISEYPLISKAKTFRAFRSLLEDFFAALIRTFHHSSVLYSDENLFENIQVWIASMSTADFRPFRHTAALISLTILNTLCDVAREVTTSVSTSRKQLESEKKKKSVNRGRVDSIKTAIQDGEKKLETIDELLQDGINTVFVHRYRDVDSKIRCECMTALGQWIRTYREFFFEGQYLRYLGWMLSDAAAQTRSIVVAQLLSLYRNKENIAGLRSFTERFRQRMVEMAAQDADVGVRALTVELLDLIRDAGLIEPGDIDIVGRLVFDSEPRVRKAAGRFFVENIQDVFDSITEEVTDEINDLFGDEDEDDFTSPKRSWIKFKCLTDVLQAYDTQENETKPDRPTAAPRDVLAGASVDSRFVLATEAVYPYLSELASWQSLAGYLLYDHSQITEAPANDTTGVVKNLYKLKEGQEVILLDVLCCAVKLRVLDIAKPDVDGRGRRAKALANRIPELQEEMAHGLAQIIPQLLNKFGAVPEAASAVLRLSHLVDLDKIQDLQKNAVTYSSLLNDINKQFLTHSDQDVLAEASIAFLHAKSSDEMREAQESKMQELWDNMVDTLSALSQRKEIREGSSISADALSELTNTLLRISNLASVTDCIHVLETVPSSRSKKKARNLEAPFDTLLRIVGRGLREEEEDEEAARSETGLVANSMRTLLFYFMWKVQALRAALSDGKAAFNTAFFEGLEKNRATFAAALVAVMRQRSGLDEMRYTATTTLLDLQTLFGTLRQAGQAARNEEDVITQTQSLVHEIDPDTQTLITKLHGMAERIYAKKLGRPLEPEEDEAPASESEIDEPSDEESDEEGSEVSERLRSTIMAEQRLCELTGKIVLAIVGRVLDVSGPRRGKLKQRLSKNKSRLGNNYREILVFLDGPKPKTRSKGKQPAKGGADKHGGTSNQRPNDKSAERVDDGDEVEDIEDDFPRIEGDDEEDLRARGLVEEDNIDDDDGEPNPPAPAPDEDEIMGD